MEAQTLVSSPVGEYYLRGVMETASGFNLHANGTFQFFFSYGALDRFGEGRWSLQRDTVVLNSKPKPEHDFALAKSEKINSDKITIAITDGSSMFYRHTYCRISGQGKEQEGVLSEDGIISFSVQPVDTIELQFEFCPEKTSVFTIEQKEHNHFQFKPEPWLMEVFFHQFKLALTKEGMTGSHPLLNGDSFNYEKNSGNY